MTDELIEILYLSSKQCQTCDRCQRFEKIKTQAPELKSIKVNEPMELVGMDLIGNIDI